MGTIRVIDLLNKIANGEEVPNKIHILNTTYIWLNGLKTYDIYEPVFGDMQFGELYSHDLLNLEVEIIEDKPKEERNINVCGTLFTKSEYDELAKSKEDKKIEKLSDELTYIKLVDNETFRKNVVKKINEIIDRLNGE